MTHQHLTAMRVEQPA